MLKGDLKNKSGALQDIKDSFKNSDNLLKQKVDAKNAEISCALEEVEKLKQHLVEIYLVEKSKLRDKVENKSLYKCDKCDTNSKSYSQFRSHILHFIATTPQARMIKTVPLKRMNVSIVMNKLLQKTLLKST